MPSQGTFLAVKWAVLQVNKPDQRFNPDEFDVFVVKSRVHFRRGFDETGYAKTIQVVDAPGDWFGTIRINALEYEFGPIDQLYPFNTETIDY
jgi:microcystin degradation protein MlrC